MTKQLSKKKRKIDTNIERTLARSKKKGGGGGCVENIYRIRIDMIYISINLIIDQVIFTTRNRFVHHSDKNTAFIKSL